jgi:hypothetical protein
LEEGFILDTLLEDAPKVVAGNELGKELERLVGSPELGKEEDASELVGGTELGSNELGAEEEV